jgi:steroid delta-isomerase-like uncharacterized protein
MSDKNKAAMRRLYNETWNQGNFEVFDEIISTDYTGHIPTPPGAPSGREGLRWLIQAYRTGFPDLQARVDDQFSEGDKVLTRITVTGTHQGPFMNIPATNKKINVTALVVTKFKDGQNVEGWAELDRFGLMQQLGVIPTQQ